jgi:hypothetical protein
MLKFPWSARYSLNEEGLERRIDNAKLGIKIDELQALANARRGVRVYNTETGYYQVFQRHPNVGPNQLLRITIDASETPAKIISIGRENFGTFQRRLSEGQYLFVW